MPGKRKPPSDGESLTFVLDEDRVLILGTDGASAPEPAYTAEVVAEDHALDLAVLRITGDEYGAPLSDTAALPFVPLGDSSTRAPGRSHRPLRLPHDRGRHR